MSSLGKRIGAYLIDAIGLFVVLIPILVIIGIGSALAGAGDSGGFLSQWVGNLLISAVFLAYFVLMEGTRGQTVGKMLLGMKVLRVDGGPVDFAAAFKRRFPFVIGALIPIPFLGSLIGLGIVIALLVTTAQDAANRGFHDKWGETVVVDT